MAAIQTVSYTISVYMRVPFACSRGIIAIFYDDFGTRDNLLIFHLIATIFNIFFVIVSCLVR